MSGVTIVMPSIDHEYARACIDTMRFVDPTGIFVPNREFQHHRHDLVMANGLTWTDGRPDVRLVAVFNHPDDNLGVAASWNRGVAEMFRMGHSWLVICSAATRFGPAGGLDFLATLDAAETAASGEHIGPAAVGDPGSRPLAVEADGGLGWHLIAFHRSVFLAVGYFDENFWPAYSEDNDLSYRIQLAYGIDSRALGFVGPLWPKVPVDATLVETAHGILRGGVTVDFVGLERYYIRKWGAVSPHETYRTPFDSGNPVSFWQSPRVSA